MNKTKTTRGRAKVRRKRVDLNLGHLDPWTALKVIATLAHSALSNGKRVDDWRVLSVILGKCNATEQIRKILPRKLPALTKARK